MKNSKNILITGATSGIGAALARYYAKPGVTLFLTGRNQHRLEKVLHECRELGAASNGEIMDISDAKAVQDWIEAADRNKTLDLVIANAGIGSNAARELGLAMGARKVFEANVEGVFNTIHPAIDAMKERGRGQVAIMSSLASFVGLPPGGIYSASKSAIRTYGEALRATYARKGVEVNVICPGFIRTPLTDKNQFGMPFLIDDVNIAAARMAKALAKNKGRIILPWRLYLVVRLAKLLPYPLRDRMLRMK